MVFVNNVYLYIVIGYFLGSTMGANILYISPTPSPSHNIWDKTLAMALRDKGHRITYVTPFEEKTMENFTTILLDGVLDIVEETIDIVEMVNMTTFQSTTDLFSYVPALCEYSLKSQGTTKLLKQAERKVQYDLIIIDMSMGQCFLPLVEMFNSPPVVATSPFGIQPYHSLFFGNSLDASFTPVYSLPYTDKMNFTERLSNYIYTLLLQYSRLYYMSQVQKKNIEFYGQNIKPYEEMERSISFLLANYDPVLDYPRSLPPAIIPVGGLHTTRSSTIPEDLKKIMDKANEGVIVFSLGTNVRSDFLLKHKLAEIVKAFSQLKQTVLWKYESEISNLPKNVIVRPWLPQNDILAHKNVKLFITHGGALSTQEAMYHAVPVVGLPFFADQHVNMLKVQSRNLGVALHFPTLTAKILKQTINDVLQNPRYKKSVRKISEEYRDQPQDALTRAVFWVEYAIRHRGAEHLRIAPRDMWAYQVYYLDIWAFLVAVLIFVILFIHKIFSLMCKRQREEKLKKNN